MKTNINSLRAALLDFFRDYSVLRLTFNNGPQFEAPSSPQKLVERLNEISTVFNADMSFNPKSPHAEKYALCLIKDDKSAEALELFSLITEDEKDLLFLHNPPANGAYISEPTADTHRKLGYEGIYQYAKLLLNKNPQRAKKLLLEIVEKVPTECYPLYLADLRVVAIKLLMDLGVHTIGIGMSISVELKRAKSHQI